MIAGTWYPANRQALEALLAGPPGPAVFDWDNTCILHDIGDATFRFQLEHLALRLPPAGLEALLPEAFAGVRVLHGSFELAARGAEILAAYRQLWPAVQAGRAESVRGSVAHQTFRTGVACLYGNLAKTPGLGAQVAYPWLTHWVDGFSEVDIETLAWQAWQAAAAEPLGRAAWECNGLRVPYGTGIVAHSEMRDLMAALQGRGFSVFVVTASHESVVRGVAKRLNFPVPPEHVFGMRPHQADYPLTYRAGKVEVIRRYVPAAPVLVAGDTNTDVDMLNAFGALRLVIHRDVRGDIEALHAAALHSDGRTLLQGRDEHTGAFVAAQRSVLAVG